MEHIELGFRAYMSSGPDVKIDPIEMDAVTKGCAAGHFVRVRQGLINPSFLVSIVEDRERKVKFLEDTRYDLDRRSHGMLPLRDIFSKNPTVLQITKVGGPPITETGRG